MEYFILKNKVAPKNSRKDVVIFSKYYATRIPLLRSHCLGEYSIFIYLNI